MKSRDVVGKRIVRVVQGWYVGHRERLWLCSHLVLEDGTIVYPDPRETEENTEATLVVEKPTKARKPPRQQNT